MQTIRLITSEAPRLQTKLKHVDIHSCWARQAFQDKQFEVKYTPSAQMLADGLTKALPGQRFNNFIKQLGLVDIQILIEAQSESDIED